MAPAGERGRESEAGEDAEMAALEALVASALAESAKVAQMEKMTEKQVDDLIAKMSRTQEKLDKARNLREADRKTLETFDPYAKLSMKAVDLLLQEGVISKDDARKIQKLQEQLAGLMKAEVVTPGVQAGMDAVTAHLKRESDKIDAAVSATRATFDARREELRAASEAFYKDWIAELEKMLDDVQKNPRVIDTLAKREKTAREAKNAGRAKELERTFATMRAEMKSLSMRHDNAFARLAAVTKTPDARKVLSDAFRSGDERLQKKLVGELQAKLRDAIVNGTGEGTLKSTSEVVPWENRSAINYADAITLLKRPIADEALRAGREAGSKVADLLTAERPALLAENAALLALFGPARSKNGDPTFWDLIPNRDRIRAGEAAKAKADAERTESTRRRNAEFQAKAREFVARGGFAVTATLYREEHGRRALVGEARGFVALEKIRRPDGQACWKVKETLNLPENAELPVGTTFKNLTMLDAKPWLRKAMDGAFRVENGRYVERLPEAPKAESKE